MSTGDLWKALIPPAIAWAMVGFASNPIRVATLHRGIGWATVVRASIAVVIVVPADAHAAVVPLASIVLDFPGGVTGRYGNCAI